MIALFPRREFGHRMVGKRKTIDKGMGFFKKGGYRSVVQGTRDDEIAVGFESGELSV